MPNRAQTVVTATAGTRPEWIAATGSVRGDLARGWSQIQDLARDGWHVLRHPATLSRGERMLRWVMPALLMFGVLGDALTTSTIGFVDGISEANPVARHLMDMVGSPQLFMVCTIVLLSPLVVPLLGRPRGFVGWCAWLMLVLIPVSVKLYLTIDNTYILFTR